jgi:hypothetical protein
MGLPIMKTHKTQEIVCVFSYLPLGKTIVQKTTLKPWKIEQMPKKIVDVVRR